MSRPELSRLRARLLRSGVAPRHVKRTVAELDAHFDDLVDEARGTGADRALAERQALEQLGDMDLLADAVCARPELRSWAANYPRIAVIVYPLACLAILPAVPLIAGVANASNLARWIACALLSGIVTATILLVLQLSITLT
ncbi:MAG: HAAS signaling domain-containing protein [Woeseiaceae bacterium]